MDLFETERIGDCMNISKFTQKSQEVVQGCEKIAMDHGHQEIGQEHMLSAMMTVDDSLIRKLIEKMGITHYPVCIAKTQYSFSDDPKNLECNEPYELHVNDIALKTGAEFIVVITGKIMTMPGLPRVPAAEKIDIDKNGNIIGIF